MDICIRAVKLDDYDALCVVYDELDTLHRVAHPELFIKGDSCTRSKAYIEEFIESDTKKLFVAVVDSVVVGFAECFVSKSSCFPVVKQRQWVQLDNIAVLEEYRNKGIASLLLDEVKAWAEKLKIDRLELKVYEFNSSAIEFYTQKGFESLSKMMFLDL